MRWFRMFRSSDWSWEAFQPHLNRWAELLVAKGGHGGKVDPREVPPEVLQHAEKSSAEVKWVLRRGPSRLRSEMVSSSGN